MSKYFFTLFHILFVFTLLSCVHDPVSTSPEAPSALRYDPDSLAVEIGTVANSEKPEILGTGPFAFDLFTEPVSDGNITINSQGVIEVSENIAEGVYSIDVIVQNEAASVEFSKAFTVRAFIVPEVPTQLIYTPSSANVLSGSAFSSNIPDIQGSLPFSYSISENPQEGIISIDDQGIISSSPALEVGTYVLDIEVANVAGTNTFDGAFTINVTSSATAPSNLNYATNILTLIQGNSGNSVTPGLDGTAPFSFSITSIPDAAGNITIDNNGVINASASLDTGNYEISVTVGNSVDTVVFTNIYSIQVNPVPPVTFLNDVRPLILQKCSSCHTGGSQINFTIYANASSGINTILDRVQRTPGSSGFMPNNRAPLSSSEIQLLQDWLTGGLQ